ncbi:ABC transporter permease [Candidatus Babeliales bacterium]|nr:ABC transporter permease [Candidatus Babeliales bacterium]
MNRSDWILPLWTLVSYVFLYVPIIILVIYSFNDAALSFTWSGFTTKWYRHLIHEPELLRALYNSIVVAALAVVFSLTLSFLFVFYNKRARLARYVSLFYGGAVLPDIVMAVGLLSFFGFFKISLGITTLVVGHTLIGIAFALPIIRARFEEIDVRVLEASADLGASERQTIFKVLIPILRPALLSAGLLVFIISMDDFLVSFFCTGSETQTLPLYIFSMIRLGVSPVINALSTVLLAVTSAVVMVLSSFNIKSRIMES